MKLIFFDIDGTLIPDNSIIMPESTKAAIRKARENGHICIINTGRTKRMVRNDITDQVEFDGFVYGCGTMAVYHGQELFHKPFTVEESHRIIEGLKHHRIDAILEGCEENFAQPLEECFAESFKEWATEYEKFQYATFDQAAGAFDKMYMRVDKPGDLQGFYEEFRDMLDFIDREHGFYEVVPKGCSKASGIEHMAKLLNVPMEDTVAIGDSNNDLTMLQCVNTSIAMGNSTQNILDIADYVTTDVDKDGIRNALEWLGVL